MYFPPAIVEAVGDAVDRHILRRELATTMAVNRIIDDAGSGLRLATARFQTFANFIDASDAPLPPVAVGPATDWFAFYDPGANWFPSALWTIISFVGFLLSLAWLDRLEQREKRLAQVVVEEPQDLAVPIAQ